MRETISISEVYHKTIHVSKAVCVYWRPVVKGMHPVITQYSGQISGGGKQQENDSVVRVMEYTFTGKCH